MYAAGGQHRYQEPCQFILQKVLDGTLVAVTNAEVHQEILHRYLAIGLPAKARQVSEDFQALVPRILPVTAVDIVRARELLLPYPDLPARDLIHVAVMLSNGIGTIISADRHFDRVAGIRRLAPEDIVRHVDECLMAQALVDMAQY